MINGLRFQNGQKVPNRVIWIWAHISTTAVFASPRYCTFTIFRRFRRHTFRYVAALNAGIYLRAIKHTVHLNSIVGASDAQVYMLIWTVFAAVEMRDNPALRDIPIMPLLAGVVSEEVLSSTANYTRQFGVRSAMPTAMALKLCPISPYCTAALTPIKGLRGMCVTSFPLRYW